MQLSQTHKKIINVLCYQSGWFICMYNPGFIPCFIAVTIVLGIHTFLMKDRLKELAFIFVAATLGFAMDHACQYMNWIDLDVGSDHTFYLLCLWLMFVSTLRLSMSFIMSRYYLAILLGMTAPLVYWIGQTIGRVHYYDVKSMVLHGFGWAIILLVISLINRRMFGHEKRTV